MSTAYHAKYFAHELTKRCASDSVQKLAASLADARVHNKPLYNFFVSMLRKMEVEAEAFGSSTGTVTGLSEI